MNLSDLMIVVVEDEADSMELVQGLLSYHSIHNLGASTAEEALKLLQTTIPALIVIDLSLPGMNGWSLLNEIRKNKRLSNIPCVAITAYHTAELAHEAIEAGFDAYFAKPLDATSFVRELVGIIES
ncbi:MAG TPA: response regulator [Anaerolineales bacterium]|nr:response regulator [Anaerolineales bacterium]HEX3051347.1 response regulator [Aggregatilineaceae bacterium]